MSVVRRHAWFPGALLVGIIYLTVGRVFARPVDHVSAWRVAAWLVSAAAGAAHFMYERRHHPDSPRRTALHVAVAVAIGAFALAVAGMLHSLSIRSSIRPVWFLALVLWPAMTALPAFLVALAAGAMLPRRRPTRSAG